MNEREERSITRLTNIDVQLGYISKDVTNMPPHYGRCVSEFHDCVVNIGTLASQQRVNAPRGSHHGRSVATLRKQLRRQLMIPLVRMARVQLKFAPGAERALVTPHATASHPDIIAAAKRLLRFLRQHRALVEESFGAKTIEKLRDATRDLERLTTQETKRAVEYAEATRALKKELQRARMLETQIDGMLIDKADQHRDIREMWKNARRTPKRLGRPKAKRSPDSTSKIA